MSVEIENPQSALELVYAAANYVAQIRIALMIGDKNHANKAVEEAASLLYAAIDTLNKEVQG